MESIIRDISLAKSGHEKSAGSTVICRLSMPLAIS